MTFRIELDSYRGPLDLLLYLVRKHELDVLELPVAAVAEQYLAYLELLQQLDVDAASEFLDLASTLLEIKSRQLLPRGGEETEQLDDPREDLVLRLLEYKKFKDAAVLLEERGRNWQQRYSRLASDLPPREFDWAAQPIQEVELWDLVSAFGRVMRDSIVSKPASIVYDDTPITTYMEQIHRRLLSEGRLAFSELMRPGMHKASLIGMFLAVLELVRHHQVHAEQNDLSGEIWVIPGEKLGDSLDLTNVEAYDRELAGDASQFRGR